MVSVLALAAIVPRPAVAAPDDPKATALEHSNRGTTAYNLAKYDEAIIEFERAYRAVPDPVFLFNIAQAHRLSARPEQAIAAYKAFLRTSRPDAPNRDVAAKHVQELEAQLKSAAAGPPRPEPLPHDRSTGPVEAPAPAVKLTATAAADRPRERVSHWAWIGTGATVLLAGGAVASGLGVRSRFDELRSSCGQTVVGCTDDQIGGLKTRVLITNVLWAGAAIAGVATGIAFVAAPGEGGISVAGRF